MLITHTHTKKTHFKERQEPFYLVLSDHCYFQGDQ